MRRILAFVIVAVLGGCALTACTPRPPAPEPVAEDFMAALAARDTDALAGLVDDPQQAGAAIAENWEGLQAESVAVTTGEATTDGGVDAATARVPATVTWRLPKERVFSYDTELNLQRQGRTWQVHWQPTVIHPRLGAHQHLELRAEPAEKASVVSSDGVAVLTPGVRHRLLIDPQATEHPAALARAVTAALRDAGVEAPAADRLEQDLRAADAPYSVALLDDAAHAAVAARLSGRPAVRFNDEAAMVTPEPGFAPDIMSRVRRTVAEELDGAAGWRIALVNPEGGELGEVRREPARPAPAVRIGLDHAVQTAAQRALSAHAEQKAVIVALRPSNGDILAVAQTPAADKDGDIALTGQYPPGSVFKMITAAAGMTDEGLVPGSTVPCPGTMDIFGRTVTNYNASGVGDTSLTTAFARSCNTTFADISTRLAPGRLQEVARQFGVGVDYAIPGLETVTGSVPFGETPLERTEAGYGQGHDLASPFGMALASATAAAGRTPTPVLVRGRRTEVADAPTPPNPEAVGQLQEMMRAVVTGGTAAGMRAAGEIHGKTGEAEVNDGSHAWFTGYRGDLAFATLVVYGGGSETSVAITDEFLRALDEPAAGDRPGPGGIPVGGAEGAAER